MVIEMSIPQHQSKRCSWGSIVRCLGCYEYISEAKVIKIFITSNIKY